MLLTLIIAGMAAAAPAKPSADAPENAADVMAFFVGSCWAGAFSDGGSTDTHCLRSVFDGAFVRDNHVVAGARGPYAGETMFRWRAEDETLSFTYWDSAGGKSEGVMKRDGDAFRSPAEIYEAPDGRVLKIESVWRITGENSWEQVSQEVSGDAPRTLWKVVYQRRDLGEGPDPLSPD